MNEDILDELKRALKDLLEERDDLEAELRSVKNGIHIVEEKIGRLEGGESLI